MNTLSLRGFTKSSMNSDKNCSVSARSSSVKKNNSPSLNDNGIWIEVGSEIVIAEPTAIQIPLSFNEGELFFFTEDDRADTEEFLSKFIDDFVKPRSDRIFMWEEDTILNIGTVYVKDGLPEIHYVSIEVGN